MVLDFISNPRVLGKRTLILVNQIILKVAIRRPPCAWHGSDFLLTQALVKHSQDKDQFLKVAIRWMMETQILEDKLKEVGQAKRSRQA
jgi:hypothetical protein